ncbi:ATP-binding cassette sub-family B member 7, partial [Durusdinium trenchii]
EVTLGTFLATLALMKDISSEFSEAYHITLSLIEELGSLRDLTVYFNKETDLLAWKVIFPQDGSIFIPSHLRVLHVTQEAFILNTSPWQNLIFGADASQVEPSRVRQILERMQMRVTLNLIEEELHEAARGTLDRKDWRKQEDGASLWLESLTYTEKVKLHLARALLMNPEVMVLHRPLHHYDADTAKMVLGLLKAHVTDRGLAMNEEGRQHRRPRTCFFTVEEKSQAQASSRKDKYIICQNVQHERTVTQACR